MKANWIGHTLCGNCLPKHFIGREREKADVKKRKTTQAATGRPKGKENILEIGRGSTRSHCLEN
jgi:hypothetical protein